MHPYETKKLTEYPDVEDIKRDGRASHVGRLSRDRGYLRPRRRKLARRNLKRADRAAALKRELRDTPED